jgi:hypothetical protein
MDLANGSGLRPEGQMCPGARYFTPEAIDQLLASAPRIWSPGSSLSTPAAKDSHLTEQSRRVDQALPGTMSSARDLGFWGTSAWRGTADKCSSNSCLSPSIFTGDEVKLLRIVSL